MDKETIMQLLADGVISNEVATRYFPDLKESGDEKIRKEILDYIDKSTGCKRWVAWIEKQAKKGTNGNEREIPFTAWGEKYEKGADDAIKGMNKTWGMEDKIMLQMIEDDLSFLRDQKSEGIVINPNIDKEIAWLKSIKDRIQTRNAWKPSKEQIIALRWILNHIPYNKHKEEISGLLDQINELKGE